MSVIDGHPYWDKNQKLEIGYNVANKHCKALPHYKICKEEKNEKRAIFQNIFDLLWDIVTKG